MTLRIRLQVNLLSKKPENEEVSLFIARKEAVFKRLKLDRDKDMMITSIENLIRCDIRIHLIGRRKETLQQLTQLATEVKNNLRELKSTLAATGRISERGANREVAVPVLWGRTF